MMYRVEIPNALNIVIGYQKTGEPIQQRMEFAEYMLMAVEGFEPLGRGIGAAEMGERLHSKLSAINGDAAIMFEEQEYGTIRAAVNAYNYTPPVNRQLLGFHRAVLAATKMGDGG